MENRNNVGQKQLNQVTLHCRNEEDERQLNFDIRSYRFHDLDLAMAVSRLTRRDRIILILRLMGHTQHDIAVVFSLSRSMISKRLTAITDTLKKQLILNSSRG